MVDIGETLKAINSIRSEQNALYTNMNQFTVQVILTHMCHSPMTVEEVFNIQQQITPTITEKQVVKLLDELVDHNLAVKTGVNEYEATSQSSDVLTKEGITKDFLFS